MFEMAYDYIKFHTKYEVIGSVGHHVLFGAAVFKTEYSLTVPLPRCRCVQKARPSLCTGPDAHVRARDPVFIKLNRS